MAGFDIEYRCTPRSRAYYALLLRSVQRAGRTRHVQLRFRQCNSGYYVTVDGPLTNIESLASYIAEFTSAVAAIPSHGLPSAFRRSLTRRFALAFRLRLQEIQNDINELADKLPGGRANSHSVNIGKATHLKGNVRELAQTLISYDRGRVVPRVCLEALHTTAETLLRSVATGADKLASFPSLVLAAKRAGVLEERSSIALQTLNRLRRNVKHRGQGLRHATLNAIIWDVLRSLHDLAAHVRRYSAA